MALALVAKLAQRLFCHAEEEARKHLKEAPVGEREREVVTTVHENLRRSRILWYKVRDEMVTRNKVFLCKASECGPEKLYAPESVLDLDNWFVDQFLEGHTFFVERTDSTVQEIGTADPVHVH